MTAPHKWSEERKRQRTDLHTLTFKSSFPDMGQALQTVDTLPPPTSDAAPNFGLICRQNGLKPRQRKVLRALMQTLEVAEACKTADIPPSTFYYWLDKPAFRACYDAAMANAVPSVEIAHFKAATGKDTLARIHILKNRHPMYREKPLEIVQRTDGNTVLAATANAIAATELSKAISLLIGATARPADPVIDVTPEEVSP